MRKTPMVLTLGALVCGLFVVARSGLLAAPDKKPVSAEQCILLAADVPWQALDNGMRRKVVFSGQLTFVLLEAKGPTALPIALHQHPNDQISYVLDGRIIAKVGKEERQIKKGDFFRVPANVPHGAQILSSSVRLIDVFTPPREDFRQ